MSADVALLVATAVLAVVAVVGAAVTVLAARRVARSVAPAPVGPSVASEQRAPQSGPAPGRTDVEPHVAVVPEVVERPAALAPRVVEGRVVVPPTQDQVVATALSRPQARISVVAQGLAHALRPESRDRIGALVRREYRARRRDRLRAGRRAARAAHASTAPPVAADQWLGER